MKKLFIYAMSLVGLIATSCANEPVANEANGNEADITYVVSAGDLTEGRATHDGDGNAAQVTRYICEVYHGGNLYTRKVNTVAAGTLETTFNLRLVSSQNYEVLFWADYGDGENDVFYVTTNGLKEVSLAKDAEGKIVVYQADQRDAFSGKDVIENLTGSYEKTVELRRPFAQLNVITEDIDDILGTTTLDLVPDAIKMTVKAATEFNVSSAVASEEETLEYIAVPYYKVSNVTKKEVSAQDYTFCTLSMNYYLAPAAEKSVEEVKMVALKGGDVLTTCTFANIPLQRNYRTNIIGNHLTDGVNYTVIINPEWEQPEKNIMDFYEDAEGNLHIRNIHGLMEFKKQANAQALSGKTIILDTDIDLGNNEWAPIRSNDAGKPFTFDGNGKTIKNLKITGHNKAVGFFGYATSCTIKNLTIDGADVTGINHVAALVGNGLCAKIENCTVKNAKVTAVVYNHDDGDKAGAICGYLSAEPGASIKDCRVEDCQVTGYRDLGGLLGYANGASEVTGNVVMNVTVTCDQKNNENYKNYTEDAQYDAKELVGEQNSAATVGGNNIINVEVKYEK